MDNWSMGENAEKYIKFVRERITELRLEKNVSEYKIGTTLGHSQGYINGITSGKSLPSFREFFYICDYLNVTPVEFFDIENHEPLPIRQLKLEAMKMSPDDLNLLLTFAQRLNQDKE